jgi:uncharacterized membrane protein required for colicin V production
MKFAYIDVFLFGGIVFAAFLGYRAGVMKKIVNLLVLFGSIVLAASMMTAVGDFFVDAGVLSETTAYLIGFVLLVAVPVIATILLYRRFGSRAMVKPSSQIMGMVLGVVEGLLIISLLLIGFRVFDAPGEETRAKSMLYRPLESFTPKMLDLVSAYLPGAAEFKEEVTQAFKKPDLFGPPAAPKRGTGKKR